MHQSLEEYEWYADLPSQTRRIVSSAVLKVDSDYGLDGSLPENLTYHNGQHTRMVCEDLAIIRDAVGLTGSEFEIAVAAASSHDVIKTFDRASGVDEIESADWLEYQLVSVTDYSRIAICAAKLAVIGTIPRFYNGTIIQKSAEQVYPNKRSELIAQAVSGADVGRLFAPEGPLLSHRLFEENLRIKGASPDIDLLVPFQQSQIEFLVNYQYPTRDIEVALATHKSDVIRYLGKLSGMLELGNIDSWHEVIRLDKDFIAAHK